MPERGLVVARHRRHVTVEDAARSWHRCSLLSRRLRPLVGDEVDWERQADGTGLVTGVAARRTVLSRIDSRGRREPVAANLTQLLVVAAPAPIPDWTLLDRYLVAAELTPVKAVIVFNKRDLMSAEPDELQDLRAIAGEYSHFGWGKLLSVPTYRENEEAGGYRTALVTYNRGNEYSMMFNLTHPDPAMREIFNDVRFRQAMSLAINRSEINELIYFGLATPSQSAPTPDSSFYEPWMTEYFAEYDPDRASALLNEMGLDQRDGDGNRLRPDGETLFINMQVAVPEEAWGQIAELVVSYWNAVGVKTQLKLIERSYYNELRGAGGHDIAGWGLDIVDIGEFSGAINNIRPHWGARAGSKEWTDWLNSGGERGSEPPDDIKQLWDLSQLWLQQPYGSASYLEIGKQFHDMTFRGLYQIGTVQRPPQPLLFKKTLKNTPPNDTDGLWSFSYRQWVMFMPEQWYFEDSM